MKGWQDFAGFIGLQVSDASDRGYHGAPEVVSRAAGLQPHRYAFMIRFDLSQHPSICFALCCEVLS
ncbi:hypothetical protein SAMN03159355_03280 [Pseudomonas sp. NFPP10]|nr:MAG: hypothetical protein DI621_13600 [Pseudomonas protegens]SDA25835.1 hypothetical protein SAMN03159465_03747 [Pseudomonas sp. NFPP12]SEL80262.1 hypothetical protein SAMN03159355_03280 [Pseudomonas sp. NFPP10]SER09569.1 hypothetical protein SAMN03159354_02877 [Pseudomonas sp. NFPP19]SFJ57869.1 hypothetical protein SAMN03159416_03696 [Pseudomonas sp. NFPP08]SFM93266.1 hypothetical protein SAMN03159476_03327 [Pseudomonas sp. NFPP05]SFX66037.1 hypothetical protein SAMN03159479_03281 [Pseudo